MMNAHMWQEQGEQSPVQMTFKDCSSMRSMNDKSDLQFEAWFV